MKKDSFMRGALVATICIVFSKILGIIYVIPFHAIIGENGRALYGYAYNMYTLFLSFSTVGIPLAVSKMVTEYNVLGYHTAKNRTYSLALKITILISAILTLVLFACSPLIARIIIRDLKGGSTVQDIAYVLRATSTALITVTVLSSLRGYLQGHKYITASSLSQVIEQFVRVIVIIFGSYIAVRLWGTKEAIAVAMLGATIGSIFALLYLRLKLKNHRKKEKNIVELKEEKEITNKDLIKKLISYTIPFIVVSIAINLYNSIDVMTILKPLVNYAKLKVTDAETVLSVISTWGAKLNSIVTSISAGVVVSVLPNVTSDFVKKDMKEVNNKINKTLKVVSFFIIPMVIGLSFLAEPVWNIFYSENSLCVSVFRYSIFTSLFYSIFLNIYTIMQSVDRQKVGNKTLIIGLLSKFVLNIPLIFLFSKISFIPTYYGSITATVIAYIIPIVLNMRDLNKNLNIKFKSTLKSILNMILSTIAMLVVLYLLSKFIPLNGGKIYSILIVALYAFIGSIVYLIIMIKSKTFENVFGHNLKDFIKSKLKRRNK